MRQKNIRITIKGTPGCKIVPELAPHPKDHHLIKKCYELAARMIGTLNRPH
jgi:hypothetical protein